MGFSLELFIEEIEAVLSSDEKASKKIRKLVRIIREGKEYAKQCGQL